MDQPKVIELVTDLEDEVNNGGFHQYFYNSSGDNTAETIQALETIGAFAVADIVRRAASKFPGAMPPKDRNLRLDMLWSNFPLANEFSDLDGEFFSYPEDLSGLMLAYKQTGANKMSQSNRPMLWVWVLRLMFGTGLVWMYFDVKLSSQRIVSSDIIICGSAMALMFISSWWRLLYTHWFYEKLIATLGPATMFLASWIRHGPYTDVYGLLSVIMLIWLATYVSVVRRW